MIKLFSLTVLISLSLTLISQTRVIDSKSGKPISYAHIKLKNGAKGVIADFNGYFSLDNNFTKKDTIVVSCIGYQTKQLLVRNIDSETKIKLEASQQNIKEVTITAKKTKFKIKTLGITKKPRNIDSYYYIGRAMNGEERAVWIPNEYSVQGKLDFINIYVTDLGFPDAHFRVHVYDCNPLEIKPGNELTSSNIIASGGEGNRWVNVDMREEKISIGENGCFIGIEWFDSPQSKYFNDTIYRETHIKRNNEWKDTTFRIERKGNGAVLGFVYKPYRFTKDKVWYKKDNLWLKYLNFPDSYFYKTDTLPNGKTFFKTPDNINHAIFSINIDVAIPKGKAELAFDSPKRRKLNRIENEKQDLFKYPQSSISELFSSLIKAFENNQIIYVLKFLCVYQEDELEEILADLNTDGQNLIKEDERIQISEHLKKVYSKLDRSQLNKIDKKHFRLTVDDEKYNLIIDEGLWKISPYSYKIYQ